jgi:hypothetical protein
MGSSYVEVCVKVRSLKNFVLGCLALSISLSAYGQQGDDVNRWFDNYLQVREFKTVNARDPFMTSEDKNEAKLGAWLNEQRLKAGKGRLSDQEKAMLNKIPGFSWDAIDEYWMNMQKAYKKFREEKGKYPSSTSEDVLEAAVGLWLSFQVLAYNNKQLCEEKVNLLESVTRHDWEMYRRQVDESYWDYTFRSYKEFREKKGVDPSTKANNETEMVLGKWLIKQRNSYKKGTLSDRRMNLMESVQGHFWGVTRVDRPAPSDDDIYKGDEITSPEGVESILQEKTKNVDVGSADLRNWLLLYTGESESSTNEQLANVVVKKVASEFLGNRSRGVISRQTASFLAKEGVWSFLGSASNDKAMIVFTVLLEEAITLGSVKTDGSIYLGRVPKYDEIREVLTIYKKGFLK